MPDLFIHLAYLGPGGPEFMVVVLVLLVLFGAKDAPRILRKINEIISQIRNTADSFKREVMYSDLENETPSYPESSGEDSLEHNDGYDYDSEEDYYNYNGDDEDSSDEVFESLEEDLKSEGLTESTDDEIPTEEDGDARKT